MTEDDDRPGLRPNPLIDNAPPVRIVRIDIPFDDVLALVFKVLAANLVIAIGIGMIVGVVWYVSGF